MSETIVAIKWALVFFTVHAPPGGKETVTHHRGSVDFVTLSECEKRGNDALAVLDMPEHTYPYFRCLPADAVAPRDAKHAPRRPRR
jgi:hypothetical protein